MELIYTIPVNEAFDASVESPACGCPLCALRDKLEEDELGLILGGSMMEPDTRMRTNALGFCPTHFDKLFAKKNRLGLGLILESHLDEVKKKLAKGGLSSLLSGPGAAMLKELRALEGSCYLCERISHNFSAMLTTTVLLYEREEAFREKIAKTPYFCLPHLADLLECAQVRLNKKAFAAFTRAVSAPVERYLEALSGDVSWFCKKFDYRYGEEPWYNAKDAVERAIRFLAGTER